MFHCFREANDVAEALVASWIQHGRFDVYKLSSDFSSLAKDLFCLDKIGICNFLDSMSGGKGFMSPSFVVLFPNFIINKIGIEIHTPNMIGR